MNQVIENILSRRSIRDFNDKIVSDENLELILKAASYAPSGMNRQSWKFTAIKNMDLISSLAKEIGKQLDKENYRFYGSKTLILVSNEITNTNGLADCACAMENIFLASNSLGIGSCWINQLKTICDTPEIRTLLNSMEVPTNHIVWGIAALGYSANTPEPKPRKQNIIHIIK